MQNRQKYLHKIIALEKKYPNDAELGSAVRSYLNSQEELRLDEKTLKAAEEIFEYLKAKNTPDEFMYTFAGMMAQAKHSESIKNQDLQKERMYNALINYFTT